MGPVGQKWGQHFLRCQATIEKILAAAELEEDDEVLEIGPGEGVLTVPLASRAGKVDAYEIDPRLAEGLEQRALSNLCVHRGDVLQTEGLLPLQGAKVVANLPYYVTAPILELLCWRHPQQFSSAVLMMQDEVARRLCGAASREAGALTYIVGLRYRSEYLFRVPPDAFSPPPKVHSAVIRLRPRLETEIDDEIKRRFERLVSSAFQARRKQLQRSLRGLTPGAPELLKRSGIAGERRPETLTVEEFLTLARNWADDV